MANKVPEIGVYVEDIPMKLSDKYKPLDFTAYIEDETQIPHLIRDDYKFSAELYALEVAELRDKELKELKQLSESMSKIDLKNERQINSDSNTGNDLEQDLSATQLSSRIKQKNNMKDMKTMKPMKQTVTSIHLNPGEILKPKPLTTNGTIISDNYNKMSDNYSDVNVLRMSTKVVNPKDFESDTSSPFDNVELQTIDDMQELNDVFQAFQSKSIQAKHHYIHDHSVNHNNNSSTSNN